ncbi:MAG: hypothetical protein CTY20_12525 [Hyphomicrobium sp.]|nr:MAG: hypothetical protein CTY20_12525 [Hyphomicrobium sp.]
MMRLSDLENPRRFTIEDANELAKTARSERIVPPFEGRSEVLLQILVKAADAYHACQRGYFDDYMSQAGVPAIAELQVAIREFRARWKRFPEDSWGAIDEFLENDFSPQGLLVPDPMFELKDRRYMCEIDDIIESLETATARALRYRARSESRGPKEKTRELKCFVAALHEGWRSNCDAPFGSRFDVSPTDWRDKIPLSAAAKLVVSAAQILDPNWNVRECETAMLAVVEGRELAEPH